MPLPTVRDRVCFLLAHCDSFQEFSEQATYELARARIYEVSVYAGGFESPCAHVDPEKILSVGMGGIRNCQTRVMFEKEYAVELTDQECLDDFSPHVGAIISEMAKKGGRPGDYISVLSISEEGDPFRSDPQKRDEDLETTFCRQAFLVETGLRG